MVSMAKFSFILCLSALFFYLFANPALKRYHSNDVIIKESSYSPPEGHLFPAITICPGWKNRSDAVRETLDFECHLHETSEDFQKCVERKTYTFNETIRAVVLGTELQWDIRENLTVISSMTDTSFGICFTLKYPNPLKTNYEFDSVILALNPTLDHQVFFHDPKFFLLTQNLKVSPYARKQWKKESNGYDFDNYPLSVKKRININRPGQTCVEDNTYNFGKCISDTVMTRVGCKFPWNKDEENFPPCDNEWKIKRVERLFFDISIMEQKEIVRNTSCNIPCLYFEYSIISDKNRLEDG